MSYQEKTLQIAQEVQKMFPKYILEIDSKGKDFQTGTMIFKAKSSDLINLLKVLSKHVDFQFDVLRDISVVDNPSKPERFEISYFLLSIRFASTICIKLTCNENTPIPSITDLYPSANWMEREAWDMYGIYFYNHPNLRRILTDYGFEGHPLRKDFPLSGFVEVRYDEESKRVLVEPVELSQEFRSFDFSSPWDLSEELKTKEINLSNEKN